MTIDELKRLFPNASASTIKANVAGLCDAQSKCSLRPEPLGPAEMEKERTIRSQGRPGRKRVVITGYRKRCLDPDNFAGGVKYVIDALRYEGVLADDSPEHIVLETRQVKVGHVSEVRTEIEIYKL